MRLVTYESDRGPRAGVLGADSVIDAWDALGEPRSGLRELLADGEMSRLEGALDGAADGIPLAGVRLLPPIPDPEKILCIGLNYGAHAEET